MIGNIVCQSSFLCTEPWGFESPNTFLNAVICVDTSLSPMDLLHATQDIEIRMGRSSKSADGKYSDRIIDIDILLYDNLHIDTQALKIPHPLMLERDFVLTPLTEIMPEAIESINFINSLALNT